MRLLTPTEKALVSNSLLVAAEQYAHDARLIEQQAPQAAEQFRNQAALARHLAEQAELHDGVALHNDNEMLRQTYHRHIR